MRKYVFFILFFGACSVPNPTESVFKADTKSVEGFQISAVSDSLNLIICLTDVDALKNKEELFYLECPVLRSGKRISIIQSDGVQTLFDFGLNRHDSIASVIHFKYSADGTKSVKRDFYLKMDTSFSIASDTIYKFVLDDISIIKENDDLVFFVSNSTGCKGVYMGFEELQRIEYFHAFGEIYTGIFTYRKIDTFM